MAIFTASFVVSEAFPDFLCADVRVDFIWPKKLRATLPLNDLLPHQSQEPLRS